MVQFYLILMIQEKRFKFIGEVAIRSFHLKGAYLYVFVGWYQPKIPKISKKITQNAHKLKILINKKQRPE